MSSRGLIFISKSTALAAACLSLTLACTGQITGVGGASGQSSGTAGGGTGTGSGTAGGGIGTGSGTGSGGTSATTSALTCGAHVTDVDETPLRRLTNAEYLNTVSDLLGDVSKLNLNFPAALLDRHGLQPFERKRFLRVFAHAAFPLRNDFFSACPVWLFATREISSGGP